MMTYVEVEKKMIEVVKDYIFDIMTHPTEWVNIQTSTILQSIAEETLGDNYEILVFDPRYDEIEKKICKSLYTALNAINAVYKE